MWFRTFDWFGQSGLFDVKVLKGFFFFLLHLLVIVVCDPECVIIDHQHIVNRGEQMLQYHLHAFGFVWRMGAAWLVCKRQLWSFQPLNWDTLGRPWQTHWCSEAVGFLVSRFAVEYELCTNRGEVDNTDGVESVCRASSCLRGELAESCVGVCLLFHPEGIFFFFF